MRKRDKGFTLVELLVVIAILAVLASVVVVSYTKFVDKAKNSNDEHLISELNRNLDYEEYAGGFLFNTPADISSWLETKGIKELKTSNEEMLIVYNKETKMFELVKDDVLKPVRRGLRRKNASRSLVINEKPYFFEEIIQGYFVVSENNSVKAATKILDNLEADADLTETINNIPNSMVRAKFIEWLPTNIFYKEDNKAYTVNAANQVVAGIDEPERKVRVLVSEKASEVDLSKVDSEALDNVSVIIPKKITEVKATETLKATMVIAGNKEALKTEIQNVIVKDTVKEAIEAKASIIYANNYLDFKNACNQVEPYLPGSKLILNSDITINENLTIPENLEVRIPYALSGENAKFFRDTDPLFPDPNGKGSQVSNEDVNISNFTDVNKSASDSVHKYRTLTINQNITLTVKGKILVGGILGTNAHSGLVSYTASKYGLINNEGTINLNNGSLDVYGYVKGAGKITTSGRSKVYEPFVIGDLPGIQNMLDLNENDANYYASPITEYSFANIQNELTLGYDSKLYGKASLSAGGMSFITNVLFVGNDKDTEAKPFVSMKTQNSNVVISYDQTKALIKTAKGANDYFGLLGKTSFDLNGDADTNAFNVELTLKDDNNPTISLSIDTTRTLLPIPYTLDLNFNKGEFSLNSKLCLYPGAKITVAAGATLNLKANSQLFVLDNLKQGKLSGYGYYDEAIFNRSDVYQGKYYGDLLVNGTLNIQDNSEFAGVVRLGNDNANVVAGSNAILYSEFAPIPEMLPKSNPTVAEFITRSKGAPTPWASVILGGFCATENNISIIKMKSQIAKSGKNLQQIVKGNTYTGFTSGSVDVMSEWLWGQKGAETSMFIQMALASQNLASTTEGMEHMENYSSHGWSYATDMNTDLNKGTVAQLSNYLTTEAFASYVQFNGYVSKLRKEIVELEKTKATDQAFISYKTTIENDICNVNLGVIRNLRYSKDPADLNRIMAVIQTSIAKIAEARTSCGLKVDSLTVNGVPFINMGGNKWILPVATQEAITAVTTYINGQPINVVSNVTSNPSQTSKISITKQVPYSLVYDTETNTLVEKTLLDGLKALATEGIGMEVALNYTHIA